MIGLSLNAAAQLTVLESGQTRIGTPLGQTSTSDVLLQNESLNASVLTPNSIDKTASLNIWGITNQSAVPSVGAHMGHITFGFGNYANIAGNSATGILRLYARDNFSLVLGSSNSGGLIWNNTTNAIISTYSMKAPAFLTTSDARLKKNVESLNESFTGLLDLNPVSYNLVSSNSQASETADIAMMISDDNSDFTDERLHFGFIAQEIQELYPNLVVEGEDGMLAIDYTGFIPLLVDAYKNLAEKVKQQEDIISELTKGQGPSYMPASVDGMVQSKATLKQNKPNPFNTSTIIESTLPEEVASAFLCVYDLQGSQVLRIDIRERGSVCTVIDASSLRPGMYIYSLVADGTEVDSKRMIITD